MLRRGKKYKDALGKRGEVGVVPAAQALAVVKDASYVKFDESVDVDVNLGIDASKGDQTVRGSVTLPHGRGREVRVIVFAKGDHVDQARAGGADHVGAEDLAEKIKGGWLEFDQAVATPDLMGLVGGLAKILGPRGLLPNKKVGTVTFEVESVVRELKSGRAFFRNDKGGSVHFSIGRVSFEVEKLQENLAAFVRALAASKPSTARGKYLRKMSISSTMGPGVQVNPDELLGTA